MKIQKRKGQVLLIAVMLLATIITVVMTVAFNSTSETQVARLETESQKALAAAEAGIDAAIKQNINSAPIPIGNLGGIGGVGTFGSQGITGNAAVTSVFKTTFVTQLLQKDEQYTLYLSDYSPSTGFGAAWSGNLTIHLVSESNQCPSIEIAIIPSNVNDPLVRSAYNTCAPKTIVDGADAQHPGTPTQIDETRFLWSVPLVSITNSRVAFIKVLGGRTKLGFESDSTLPIQGKTVESEARTSSGVVKKVQLFQSFPQIPSNFFMTGF